MSAWQGLVGQSEAIAELQAAAAHPREKNAMTHAWLITGPPGSGRSNLGRDFAQSLVCERGTGCGECQSCVLAESGTHPDLRILRTEKVVITIDDVRSLIASAQLSPAMSRFRVQVIEDADRMSERTSNLLLKSLEEPPEQTVWVLCAPSEVDLMPTIRSRTRIVRLTTPTVDEVSSLLEAQLNIDHELAEQSARQAQSHIGMARRLATDEDVRNRRLGVLRTVMTVRGVGSAVYGAQALLEIAQQDSRGVEEFENERERLELLRQLGLQDGDPVPRAFRPQLKTLADDQKRRSTRSLRDGLDRVLLDIMTLWRDVVLVKFDADQPLINGVIEREVRDFAATMTATAALRALDAAQAARVNIMSNVAPILALEGMLVAVDRRRAA